MRICIKFRTDTRLCKQSFIFMIHFESVFRMITEKKKSTDGKGVNEDKNFLLYAKGFSKLASSGIDEADIIVHISINIIPVNC